MEREKGRTINSKSDFSFFTNREFRFWNQRFNRFFIRDFRVFFLVSCYSIRDLFHPFYLISFGSQTMREETF